MKVGDLVRPRPVNIDSSIPIVEQDWIGIVIGFSEDRHGSQGQLIESGGDPVVYWNPGFHSEIEYCPPGRNCK